MQAVDPSSVYHPRQPQQAPLWQLLNEDFHDFELNYDERCVRKYGYPRQVVSDVVTGFLDCGGLRKVFARIRCHDCHHEQLLAFCCRGRWFCPSCHAKKVVQFGIQLSAAILSPVPHLQYVFSTPRIIRQHFKYNRKLLGKFCHYANHCLKHYLRTALNLPKGEVGAVMAIQTFGDYGHWHPLLHVIVADGLFASSGVFHAMPRVDVQPLAELFRAEVLKMLLKEERISACQG